MGSIRVRKALMQLVRHDIEDISNLNRYDFETQNATKINNKMRWLIFERH